MRKLRAVFVTGCLVLVPILVTVNVLRWFIEAVDQGSRKWIPTFLIPIDFPGLGLALAIVIILFTGLLAQNYFGTWFVSRADSWIRKISIVGGLYGSIKQFLETIFNPRSGQFKGCVLVEFPKAGIYSIGFRTGTPDPKLARRAELKLTNVFVPCTPNPTSGFYLLVPEEQLIPLDLSVQEAFKIVVSMGIVHSEDIPSTLTHQRTGLKK